MTREGWREAVIEAMASDEAGDPRFLDLIADLLADDNAVATCEVNPFDLGAPLMDLFYGVKERLES